VQTVTSKFALSQFAARARQQTNWFREEKTKVRKYDNGQPTVVSIAFVYILHLTLTPLRSLSAHYKSI
jgi:hypothetical protein